MADVGATIGASIDLADGQVPFVWDRRLTAAELEAVLARPDHPEFVDLLALTLRQARPEDVWRFIRPEQVAREFSRVESRLGRRRAFWRWLLDSWRALGYLA